MPRVKQTTNIGIVGGGILGLSLGYRFAKDGHEVTIYERDTTVGGFLRSIEAGGLSVDRFYHAVLKRDRYWLGLIRELGLGDRVYFQETRAGFYSNGKTYPLSTIAECLRFPILSFADRIRLAAILQYCRMHSDWRSLEDVPVEDFLRKKGGEEIFRRIWKPLLKAKFDGSFHSVPMTYIWSRVRRMASTRKALSQREVMGHIRGNLQVVIDTLQDRIEKSGGKIATGAPVDGFAVSSGAVRGVLHGGNRHDHDVVISTVPFPHYQKLLPKEMREQNPPEVQYMGIVCILLVLKKQLTPYYTLNLVDETVPYTAVIETTNVIDTRLMNGRHLVYLPKYVSPDNRKWFARSDEDITAECFRHLRRMFADFSEKDVDAVVVSREAFVEPLYGLGFYRTIPSFEGPIRGLFVANNSQTYPFLLNCESVVALSHRVVERVYGSLKDI